MEYTNRDLLIGFIILFIVLNGVLYGLASLSCMDFDPRAWTPSIRFMSSLITCFLAGWMQQLYKSQKR